MARLHKCLVVTADNIPVARISPERALVHLFKNNAYMILAQEGEYFRSEKEAWPVPAIIGMFRHTQLPDHFYGHARLTSHNLAKRDNWTCQYCGRRKFELKENEFMTRDHVFPVSRGGEDIWVNVVLACITCNNMKSDRTPQEANMPLRRQPYAPSRSDLNREAMEIVYEVARGERPLPELEGVALEDGDFEFAGDRL